MDTPSPQEAKDEPQSGRDEGHGVRTPVWPERPPEGWRWEIVTMGSPDGLSHRHVLAPIPAQDGSRFEVEQCGILRPHEAHQWHEWGEGERWCEGEKVREGLLGGVRPWGYESCGNLEEHEQHTFLTTNTCAGISGSEKNALPAATPCEECGHEAPLHDPSCSILFDLALAGKLEKARNETVKRFATGCDVPPEKMIPRRKPQDQIDELQMTPHATAGIDPYAGRPACPECGAKFPMHNNGCPKEKRLIEMGRLVFERLFPQGHTAAKAEALYERASLLVESLAVGPSDRLILIVDSDTPDVELEELQATLDGFGIGSRTLVIAGVQPIVVEADDGA